MRAACRKTYKFCARVNQAKQTGHFRRRKSLLQKLSISIQFCTALPDRPTPMLLGYARVSTDDQDLALQRMALREAGCRRIYAEKVSGAQRDRPELNQLLDNVREEDVIVVTRLDRLARSTRDLLDISERLRDADAGLRSLAEPWADTTSPAGRMVLTVFAGIAEFERPLILGRTSAGRLSKGACDLGDHLRLPRIRSYLAAGW